MNDKLKAKLKILSTTTLLGAGLMASVSAQANVIDLFQVAQSVSAVGEGSSAFSEVDDTLAPGSILGGYRDVYAEVRTAGGAGDTTSVKVNNGFLSFSNDAGVNGFGAVQWDGNDNLAALDHDGLGGANLVDQDGCPAGGCDRFTFSVHESDGGLGPGGAWFFTIGLYTDEENWTEFDLAATVVDPDFDPIFVREILFSEFTADVVGNACNTSGLANFTNPGVIEKRCGIGGTVDVEDLGAMQVIFNIASNEVGVGTRNLDLTIGAITKTGIPEPGTLGLLGLGLAATGLARRRKASA